ncbi:MAG: ABC transporter permease, partial [Phycisphaeraceae bacterium]|nr:ABC transporter permease [Phycisphaeraceae bacterium]
RMLLKRPGFTAIALITLAIGIGANTIMFIVVNALLFRPTLVQEPERLVECHVRNFMGGLNYEAYLDVRDDNPVFSDLVAYDNGFNDAAMVLGTVVRRITFMHVSANYFSALGVTPALGRAFLPEEEQVGAQPVAVLSHHLWKQQGADPEVLGTHLRLNGVSFQMVGVAPVGFMGTSVLGPDLWVSWNGHAPVNFAKTDDPESLARDPYPASGVKLMGRLKSGLDWSAAQAQLQAQVPRLREMNPRRCKSNCMFLLHPLSRLSPANGENSEQEQFYLFGVSLFLMGVSAVILLIVCLNLGNMLIIQGATRHREIAIRMAMGGGRWRIVRQLALESLLLALLGGSLGLALAFWGSQILNVWLATGHTRIELAVPLKTGFDVNALMATAVVCVIATVLFGLKPALRLSRRDVSTDLKESGYGVRRTGSRTEWMLPRGLSLICQIALSVVLVMGAVLFSRGALKAVWLDCGFNLDNKLLIKVDPIAGGYDSVRSVQVHEKLVEHLKTLPGIQTVAVSNSFPLERGGRSGGLLQEYDPGVEIEVPEDSFGPSKMAFPLVYHSSAVGVNYFNALEIPLLQGRAFRELDSVLDAEKLVIIDERLARQLRPDGKALGCLIQYDAFFLSSPSRVIGIVPTLRSVSENKNNLPHIYEPIGLNALPTNIHVRVTETNSAVAMAGGLSEEIRRIDPRLPIMSVTTLADYHRNNELVWVTGVSARIALIFGALALFLASLGIYAVKGHMVASRTPEIGIRMALGATRQNIVAMVFREGLLLTIVGLLFGLLLGLGAARIVANRLYNVNTNDPISIILTISLLGIASLVAGYFPARRAAKIDPMEALRYE